MLVKCETKSNRVKGLSFHPRLNWILASLHNGVIQLWDYRIGSLLERFEEHEGPVRAVDFHITQPIFVSGGDDYKIKLWNYRQRRCVFTLIGHMDYIRTVEFHQDYPWILSASDDQTVRIWNWQSRACLAVMAGHNYYVMSAQFHPKQDDLVVSASLDQTIRIWDVSGLREKTVSSLSASGGLATAGPASHHTDFFGTNDAVCKFILEGHERGVNWATLHPTLPLVASGADDRTVKLWRFNDSKWWEVDTLRGHFNNVSAVVFHPIRDLLMSISEDRTIRVWDLTRRTLVHTFRRENDRFWIMAALRNSNVLAVGHDSGMIVFKLNRERPASDVLGDEIFFVRDRCICRYRATDETTISVLPCRRATNALSPAPHTLSLNRLNPAELNILLHYVDATEGSDYNLIVVPDVQTAVSQPHAVKTYTGTATSVAFIARKRFVAIDPLANALLVYSLENEIVKKFDQVPGLTGVPERLFYAGNNRVLIKADEEVCLFDITAKKIIGDISCPGGVRYVNWNEDMSAVALVCKHHIIFADSKLNCLGSVHENIRVKGGAWDSLGVYVYSTLSHLKYCLPTAGAEDQGIIACLHVPAYVLKVQQPDALWYIGRQTGGGVQVRQIDCTEYLFKKALELRQMNQVALLIRQAKLCGNSIVSYLRKKGFSDVALQFVDDVPTRFNLSLEYGLLEEATAAAEKMNQRAAWDRLAVEAMRQGRFQLAEQIYQRTKNLEKLSFLYLCSGNMTKLRMMMQIAETQGNVASRFHTALLLGDVEERIRVLSETGQLPLAALSAKMHNIEEFVEDLEKAVEGRMDLESNLAVFPKPTDLVPPTPVDGPAPDRAMDPVSDWERVKSIESHFFSALGQTENLSPEAAAVLQQKLTQQMAGTGPDGKGKRRAAAKQQTEFFLEDDILEGDVDAGWGGDLNVGEDDFGTMDPAEAENVSLDKEFESNVNGGTQAFVKGEPVETYWRRSRSVYTLVAGGAYDDALDLLNKRIGLINPQPLERVFELIIGATTSFLPLIADMPVKQLPVLEKGCTLTDYPNAQPARVITQQSMFDGVKEAHKIMASGKIEEALDAYRFLLAQFSALEVTSLEEEQQLLDLLVVIRNYTQAMSMEAHRQKLAEDQVARNVELAAYLGCMKLHPPHQFLTYRRALAVAWKAGNYITASIFARQLVQGNWSAMRNSGDAVTQAKKILRVCETKATDAHEISFEASDLELECVQDRCTPICRYVDIMPCFNDPNSKCRTYSSMWFLRSDCAGHRNWEDLPVVPTIIYRRTRTGTTIETGLTGVHVTYRKSS